MFKKIKHKGFTLIELMVVIAIIGLLSTLAVVALNNARSKGRDAKRVSDIKQIQTALELYFASENSYPPGTAITLGADASDCMDEDGIVAACDVGGTEYMGKVPANPSPYATGFQNYVYSALNVAAACAAAPCKGYEIVFGLEGVTGDLPAVTALYATPSGVSTTDPTP